MSETAPEPQGTAQPAEQPAEQPPAEPQGDDGKTFTQADVDRIIQGRLSKYADYDQLKQEVDSLRAASQTETERAINEAKQATRTEVQQEVAPKLVAAEFRVAAHGRMTAEQLSGLLEDLDLSKYLTPEGEVDQAKVAAKVDLLAPAKSEDPPVPPTFGGGPRPGAPTRAGSLGEAIQNRLAGSNR